MTSALIIDAVLLIAVFEADLGRHRKIGWLRILRPLGIAAGIIPLYLKAVTTHGAGLSLEIGLAALGVGLGLLATALMSVYHSPQTGRPVSRTGVTYGLLWFLVIGARAAFTYGSNHWFTRQLTTWQVHHGVSVAAITDALIFEAVAMLLTRTIAMAVRAHRLNRRSLTVVDDAPGPRPILPAQVVR